MYWENLVKEFLQQKEQKYLPQTTTQNYTQSRIQKNYIISEDHPELYLTRREAECVLGLLRGKTIVKAATELGISPRTFEYYMKNVKTKLGCHTKYDLLELVRHSNFMQSIDFE